MSAFFTSAVTPATLDAIKTHLAAANGRRRERLADMADLRALVFELIRDGRDQTRHTHTVAGAYKYPAQGTYAAAARRTGGAVVLAVWVEAANRAGVLPGVSPYLKKADKIQAAVDALAPGTHADGGLLVLTPEEAAAFAADSEGERALLLACLFDKGSRAALHDWLKEFHPEHAAETFSA